MSGEVAEVTPDEAKRIIVREGRLLGFTALGVSPVTLPDVETERLREWLGRGYQGTMDWMARRPEGRTDAESLLPGAACVLLGALEYYSEPARPSDPAGGRDPRARISMYAEGRDYHRVLKGLWKRLMPVIEKVLPGVQGRWFVDSAPILEKAYAERAGLGWRGKHTNLIRKGTGSWFFIGGIVLDRALPFDSPATDHCGSCTLCIDACPTDAITEPYTVDSTRCISYLTIEHHGEVSQELDDLSGDWLFGCDICQEVCPWNRRFPEETPIKDLQPRPAVRDLSLHDAVRLGKSAFDERFEGMAIRRAGWDRFSRSAARAIRNRKEA